ncbi:MAG: hypothetical protein ABF377_15285 [Akkermansiaceae bacterium]
MKHRFPNRQILRIIRIHLQIEQVQIPLHIEVIMAVITMLRQEGLQLGTHVSVRQALSSEEKDDGKAANHDCNVFYGM